jgi:rod shape-determining protein MreD
VSAIVLIKTRRDEPQYRWRLVLGSGIALLAIHTMALPRFNLGHYTPDLFTLVALYIGLYAHRQGRYWPSLVFGLMRDFFSLGLLGSYAVLYSLLHKFAGRVRLKLDPDSPPIAIMLTFIGVFLVNFGYHFMMALSVAGVGWSEGLWRCLTTAAVTAPFAMPIFPLMHFGLRAMGMRRLQGGYWGF